MPQIDHEHREILSRILFYGPAGAGKLTALNYIHQQLSLTDRTDLVEQRCGSCELVSFDYSGLAIGRGNSFKTRFRLQVAATASMGETTRDLLDNVDGVIFVADSNPEKVSENLHCWLTIERDLSALNIPCVLLYNKRDLPSAMPLQQMDSDLAAGKVERFEAVATHGLGLHTSLKSLTHSILNRLIAIV